MGLSPETSATLMPVHTAPSVPQELGLPVWPVGGGEAPGLLALTLTPVL